MTYKKRFRTKVKIIFEGEVFGEADHKAEFVAAINDGDFGALLGPIDNQSEFIKDWDFPMTHTDIKTSKILLDNSSEYGTD